MNDQSVELYFEEFGQGTPIVFLHGFPLNHTTWEPVATRLKDKARCVLPDLRGHGKSPLTGNKTTISVMAGDVIRMLDKLQIPRAVYVGHSMGGYVAMHIGHSFAERTIGLGLVATRSDQDDPGKIAARLESREDVLSNGTATLVESMSARLTPDPQITENLREIMAKAHPQGVAMAQFAMANRENASPWLREFHFPVVVVAGANDIIVSEESMQLLANRLPDARYYSNPIATHMVLMEDPAMIARALDETFLRP